MNQCISFRSFFFNTEIKINFKKLQKIHTVESSVFVDEDACPNLSPAAPSECIIKIGSEDAKTSNVKPDKMEETLTCIICQELLHDCVRYV